MDTRDFQQIVYDYYHDEGRHDLPWRQAGPDGKFDPYRIMVSEIMLQQTQVGRVIPKFAVFLTAFPTVQALAAAPLGDVLAQWSGLGYNRRAKFLHQTAQRVVTDYNGVFPSTQADLTALPGIGVNTAGAIMAYAHNVAVVFIETNIRTVYIHHFFGDETAVPEPAIRQLVAETLDQQQPRDWYWALMDYGSFLKRSVGNLSRSSAAYHPQSKFEGSRRQVRGKVIRQLTASAATFDELQASISDERLEVVLAELVAEALIRRDGSRYVL
ncbi:MAG: mutY [Candidatus Saccharibacteria bacterium]|nr:mutY [Candidatus Saccharibacteria bacterium]